MIDRVLVDGVSRGTVFIGLFFCDIWCFIYCDVSSLGKDVSNTEHTGTYFASLEWDCSKQFVQVPVG